MAATRNFNAHNEDMEINLLDDITDPDVEARLYSEIYYSNDTYPDLPESLALPPSVPAPSTSSDSTSRDSPHWPLDPQPGRSKSPSLGAPQEIPQYSKRKKHRPLIDGLLEVPSPPKTSKPYPIDNRPSKSPKNDSPRGNHRRREYNPPQKSRKSREHPWREKTNRDHEDLLEEEEEPDSTSLTAIDEAMTPTVETTAETPELVENTSKTPEETPDTSNDSSTRPEVQKNDEEAEVHSKYKVEKKKLKKIKSAPVAEIFDSDDSILEVPVPPKPVPPLISLQDSDESSSEEEVVKDTVERTRLVKNSSADTSRSSSPVVIEDSDDTRDSSAATEATNLILNCSHSKKGASSLAEIKRMRERERRKARRQSDEESMTESEAMKWGSLEGEVEKNQGEKRKQLWEEFSDERDSRRNSRNESRSSRKPSDRTSRIPSERTVEKRAKESGRRRERADDRISRAGKRNREGRAESETPRKKRKRKERQDKEMSFEEYLLQPMPQQLIDFYNEPRGGDILRDIKEIQNDMPKNPSRWMILDADMYPVQRRRRNVCVICQQEGHMSSRCPERRKAPTCHICGVVGHSEPRCKENKKCITCGKRYSTCRRTCENCNRLRCSMCNGRGHTLASCPDNWRKYHQTTSGLTPNIPSDPQAIMKPARRLSCSNCTRRGHDSTTCTNYRWSGHFLQPCYVRDYTKGPTYTSDSAPPSPQKLPDLREPLNIERLGINVNSPSTYLFHFVNLNSSSSDPSSWKECSLIPNNIPVDYPPPYETPVHPIFLKTHFNSSCAPMEVFVKRSYELQGLPVITMRTPDERSLDQLRIIVNQWLTRPRDDKQSMSEIQPLPQTRHQLLQSLRMNFTEFGKRRVSCQFRKQFPSCFDLQRFIAMASSRRTSDKNSKFQGLIESLTDIKYGFVAATYKYLLFDTSLDVLKKFYEFFKKVEELPDGVVPGEIYISAVWYYFELFTPHLSPVILGSIMAWRKDPEYHVRGETAYKQWIREVFNSIRGNGSEGASEEMDVCELSSGVEAHSPEAVLSVQINQRTDSGQEDCEVIDVEGTPDSGEAGLKAEEAFASKTARRKAAIMKRLIARNVSLGLSEDVPLPKDPREFTQEFLAEYTHKALEVAKQRNLSDIKMRVSEILQKHGFAHRGLLIRLWVNIRQELSKRQKLMAKKRPTFTTTKKKFRKKKKKNKDTYLP